jgi:diaminohydroxyphosphoribosylaminopyrimidine deaminase/5-amino-6-(5-phosphoribosylamino)uracil reductase
MDIKYMKRAIELAKKGKGYTNPNPMVGAVIVKNGQIIGEGYHKKYGEAHAEVNAFNNATVDPKGATMYVTLEPCAHHGNTPPCAEKIVEKQIKKVVIGLVDPNPLVNHKGIEILEAAGVEVITGILSEEIKEMNEIFYHFIQNKTPYVIMKTAMSLDGKIATKTGDSKWISNEKARYFGHELRHEVSGILVGINTVLIDNPQLTTRLKGTEGKDPHRIVLDSTLKIPLDSKILNLKSEAKTFIATTEKASKEKIARLESLGVEVISTQSVKNQVDLHALMKILGAYNIDSLLIEGGGTVNFSFLKNNLVHKIYTFIAPMIIGGSEAKTPVSGEGISFIREAIHINSFETKLIDNNLLVIGKLKSGGE